jgi:hypothetical protein
MALRYDREQAKALKVWKLLCRMAQAFRDEDQRDRAGRKSWNAAPATIAGKTHLFADVVVRRR